MSASPLTPVTAMASNTHISASQQWQLANLTRQKVSREAHGKEPNLRRLVGLCNTLDSYSTQLEQIHSARHIPSYHDSTIDDDSEGSDDEQEHADYGEGVVLEWFGEFGDEDAPTPTSSSEGKIVDVTVSEVKADESEDSESEEEDSDGSSWGDEEDEQYFSDSSVEEAGSEKD